MTGTEVRYALGESEPAVGEALEELRDGEVPRRIRARDHTVWRPEPDGIADRLGWLDAPAESRKATDDLVAFARAARQNGLGNVVLLGMGGSSLAPEVFRRVFGVLEGGLDLEVLDSTHPDAVRAVTGRVDLERTLFLVASKSGTTVETRSLFRHFWTRVGDELGAEARASRFAAVTDPGSELADLGDRLGFRRVFLADPDIGGRYSALSAFGLVPASLVGIEPDRLLDRAIDALEPGRTDGRAAADLAGARLGAAIGGLARAGRDKLTVFASPALEPVSAWIEQLVAESTGKDGTGILPVPEGRPASPDVYGDDRAFVYLRLEGEPERDEGVRAIERAGHPVVTLPLADRYDLATHFVVWELATAAAGHLLGIHPFDQPNVEAAKRRAREATDAYREAGSLPGLDAAFEEDGIAVVTDRPADDLEATVVAWLAAAGEGEYVAVQAFVPPTPETSCALEGVRLAIRDRTGRAATWGYGPRFLHSTGQLHKGGPAGGRFLQIVAEGEGDVPIPDDPGSDASSMTFGVLLSAQALGDRRALLEADRSVLRLETGADVHGALERVRAAVES